MTESKQKTFYIRSIEELSPEITVAYNYRRNKETLGVMFYTVGNDKWYVFDYMNLITNEFDTEKQARTFIKNCTPVYLKMEED